MHGSLGRTVKSLVEKYHHLKPFIGLLSYYSKVIKSYITKKSLWYNFVHLNVIATHFCHMLVFKVFHAFWYHNYYVAKYSGEQYCFLYRTCKYLYDNIIKMIYSLPTDE